MSSTETKRNTEHGRCRLFVYFTANPDDFPTHQRRILFMLSYMKGGITQMWAESYIERVMTEDGENFFDTWIVFLRGLDKAFTNPNAERAAQSELEMLRQDRRTAEEFFFHFEQAARKAGYREGHEGYLISLLERNMNSALVDKVYQSTPLPQEYGEWKEKLIELDQLWRRREE
jgi:hypothetical protein